MKSLNLLFWLEKSICLGRIWECCKKPATVGPIYVFSAQSSIDYICLEPDRVYSASMLQVYIFRPRQASFRSWVLELLGP